MVESSNFSTQVAVASNNALPQYGLSLLNFDNNQATRTGQNTVADKRNRKLSEAGNSTSRKQSHMDKVIVDGGAASQKLDNNFHENIQKTVTEAINSVERDHTIKITSNLYEEDTITITKPGFIIQPKEKGGEVTI